MKSILLIGAGSTLALHAASAFQSTFHVQNRSPERKVALFSSPVTGAATIDVSEFGDRDLANLDEWAINCGAQMSPGFEIRQTLDSERSDDAKVHTNQDLPVDSPILFVPEGVILSGQKAKQEMGSYAAQSETMLSRYYGPEEVSKFYLFLKLLVEVQAGQSSPYYDYINSLPRFFSNGASMTDFCYGCLPPYAAKLALEDRQKMKLYVEALEGISILSRDTCTNEDLAKWAFAVVSTRGTDLPNGDFGIVPIADYFNHGGAYEVNSYISFDEQGNCYAYSSQDVPAGSPLLVSYGDPTNPSKLMARYGFLDLTSPATYCKYIIDKPTEEMKAMGYPDQMLFYTDGSISQEVWDVILYEQLGKIGSPQQQQLYQAFMSGDEATKQSLHQEHFALTMQALRSHANYLENEIEELEIGMDTMQKQGTSAQFYPRLPLIQRHNNYVKDILGRVQQNLNSMGQ